MTEQPLYEHPPVKYSAERILQILLDPNLREDQVCQKKPINVTCSATFVVVLRKLQSPEDIKKDEFGIWNYSGSHPPAFRVTEEEGGSLRCASGATGNNVVHLRRLCCTHPSNPDFKRLICYVHVLLLFGSSPCKRPTPHF